MTYESSEFSDKTFRVRQVLLLQVQGVGCRRQIFIKPVSLKIEASSSLPQNHLRNRN